MKRPADIDQLRVEAWGPSQNHALVQSMLKVDAVRRCVGHPAAGCLAG
jgi:hypothetical protein